MSQKINRTQAENFPGKLMASSQMSAFNFTSETYIPNSSISVTMPPECTTLVVHVSLEVYMTNTSGEAQGVVELRNATNGGGTMINRRVPTTAKNYAASNISHVLTGLTPGNTYSFSLVARTSTGADSIQSAASATNFIYALLG